MNHKVQSRRIFPILAAIAPIVLYVHSLWFSFIYDDGALIIAKLLPRDMAGWITVVLSPYYEGLPYYRPLPALLFTLERYYFALNPLFYHLTNVLFASLLSLAIYFLLRVPVFAQSYLSGLGLTLICISHPIFSSTVYMISGREALLALVFIITTLSLALRGRFGWGAALMLFAALLTRESSVFVIPILSVILYSQFNKKQQGTLKWSFFRLTTVIVVYLTLRHNALLQSTASISLNDQPLVFPLSLVYAISSIVLPTFNLHYEPELGEWLRPERLALLVPLLVLFIYLLREYKLLTNRVIGWLFVAAIISALPTANIFSQETPFDERHLLAPMIFLVLALAISTQNILQKHVVGQRQSGVICIAAIVLCSMISFQRGQVFRSDDSFFDNWIRSAPDRAKVLNQIAIREFNRGDVQGGLELLNRSIELAASNVGYLYRSRIYRSQENLVAARADLEAALAIQADSPFVLCDLALIDLKEGDLSQAQHHAGLAQKYDVHSWCADSSDRVGTWQNDIKSEELDVSIFPASIREELRNFDSAQGEFKSLKGNALREEEV